MNEHYINKSASASASASASSSSSLNSSFQDTEDDEVISRILAEESPRNDGRLGKRLSHLDSIPLTPRINGEIPDVSDATLDHERLSERLATYGLAELQMEGDGNCQFRALADQLFRNPDYHKHVRKKVVKQLKHFRKSYEGYVPMKYRSYVKKMKKSDIWIGRMGGSYYSARSCRLFRSENLFGHLFSRYLLH
ncbi:OVARIAN TUMOR DOMAIN-containing deubiquitinating enzyme 11 isoform X2 [Rhododendron vialii]|uniref:OVARIAN TUMOR DOMAIN-containing deubiquitinating enzyme 11 isoform X2 n=1 Tax=Rhododendron vialii TaxID=182163 RepID=UPI00265F672F|nr:OVARIAN TUMOR DOMAIN-containing deubiquitinating enzyme 11 isoform X2 [Rhododendron vialii]